MAYADEKNAFARLVSCAFNGSAIKGFIGGRVERISNRDPRRADGSTCPVSRPVLTRDAMATIRFLDQASARPDTDSAGNIVITVAEGNGNSGSLTIGPMVPSNVTHDFEAQAGGYVVDQVFELEGSAITYTPVV